MYPLQVPITIMPTLIHLIEEYLNKSNGVTTTFEEVPFPSSYSITLEISSIEIKFDSPLLI